MRFKKNVTSIVSIIFVFIFAVSLCYSTASATYYENTFPYDETGLTGGAYIECASSLGDIVIVLPMQYRDNYLTFTTGGNLFNASASSISVVVFHNGNQYSGRFSSFATLQYRTDSSYNYIDVVTSTVSDTNVIFCSESNVSNDNYYFSKFEIASLSVDIAILFFVFLGWFLWHRQR